MKLCQLNAEVNAQSRQGIPRAFPGRSGHSQGTQGSPQGIPRASPPGKGEIVWLPGWLGAWLAGCLWSPGCLALSLSLSLLVVVPWWSLGGAVVVPW